MSASGRFCTEVGMDTQSSLTRFRTVSEPTRSASREPFWMPLLFCFCSAQRYCRVIRPTVSGRSPGRRGPEFRVRGIGTAPCGKRRRPCRTEQRKCALANRLPEESRQDGSPSCDGPGVTAQLLGLAWPARYLFLPRFVVLHFHFHAHPWMNAALKIVVAIRQVTDQELAAL
jgi:hypothetical protein